MGRSPFRSARRDTWGRRRRRAGRSTVPLHRRLVVGRSAIAYWLVVAVLALTTGWFVSRVAGRAAAAERRWGSVQPVLVTVRSLPAGRPVPPDALRREERPVALVPEGALRRPPGPAPLAAPMARGDVLTTTDLAPTSADLAPGRVAMALPVAEAALELRPGQRVDVLATFDPSLAPPGAEATSRVAVDATVLRADAGAVSVAVDAGDALPLATALAQATVTPVLVG